jgi:hypothetical protein
MYWAYREDEVYILSVLMNTPRAASRAKRCRGPDGRPSFREQLDPDARHIAFCDFAAFAATGLLVLARRGGRYAVGTQQNLQQLPATNRVNALSCGFSHSQHTFRL